MSTYSPSLRIELITTGDQAGTWGVTTNSNLGTLIEDAITGYTSVAVASANQALTALNGVADESRNASLALTTSTGANFAVYAPPAEKTYVIYNASSYTATIYNSTVIGNTTAAGTGVAIPAGKTVTVWSDGTNFAFQNNHLSSLTLATDLAIVDGGTGASTASDARTNLDVPSRTGSGASGVWAINISGVAASATNANYATSAGTASTATSAAFATNAQYGMTQSPGTNNTYLATTAFVQTALQLLHPVGSIYMNATNATNPASIFGFGTWVAFGAGRVPVGFDATNAMFNTAEKTGGSYDATLPSHTHTWSGTSTGSSGSTDLSHTHSFTGSFSGTTGIENTFHSHVIALYTASDGSHTHTLNINSVYRASDCCSYAFPQANGAANSTQLSAISTAGAHTHYVYGNTGSESATHDHDFSGSTSGTTGSASTNMNHSHSVSVTTTGSNSTEGTTATNANVQPYITVYMWKRTA